MILALHNYNIVRVRNGHRVSHCTVIKMHYDGAQIKFQNKLYWVPYDLMDQVVGHELLMAEPQQTGLPHRYDGPAEPLHTPIIEP